ncbi:MAG: energy transducer TonB [Bacteroidales bacterium]|jgi:TonB family protein|nr:energy transducer TonB [Bacteroidales bacterium]
MSKNFNISELQDYLSEDILLKYINNKLSEEDVEKVEFLLQHDKMYSDLLDGLMMLDEPEDIILEQALLNKKIDTFSRNIKKQNARKYAKFRSVAAIIVVLFAFGGVFYFINNLNIGKEEIAHMDSTGIISLNDTTYYFTLSEKMTPVADLPNIQESDTEMEKIAEELIIVDEGWVVMDLKIATNEDEDTKKLLYIPDNVPAFEEEITEPVAFSTADEKPEFPGGDIALMKFISENTEYPQGSKENGIYGRVFAEFTIDSNGKVKDITIVKGLDPAIDAEVVRVISILPDWKPGKVRGKAVPVKYIIPVSFKL